MTLPVEGPERQVRRGPDGRARRARSEERGGAEDRRTGQGCQSVRRGRRPAACRSRPTLRPRTRAGRSAPPGRAGGYPPRPGPPPIAGRRPASNGRRPRPARASRGIGRFHPSASRASDQPPTSKPDLVAQPHYDRVGRRVGFSGRNRLLFPSLPHLARIGVHPQSSLRSLNTGSRRRSREDRVLPEAPGRRDSP